MDEVETFESPPKAVSQSDSREPPEIGNITGEERAISALKGGAGISGERGGVITARGTGDGLILRLDGRVDGSGLKEAIIEFLNSRKGFLSGNEVALEWVGVVPHRALLDELSILLSSEFNIRVRSSVLWEPPVRTTSSKDAGRLDSDASEELSGSERTLSSKVERIGISDRGSQKARTAGLQVGGLQRTMKPVGRFNDEESVGSRAPSLFDGIEAFGSSMEDDVFADEGETGSRNKNRLESRTDATKVSTDRGAAMFDPSVWDDPDARIIYATLRSGQKIETEHTLIVFGDVNSGAEVIAGGDIVILGTLRGIAHAGAYDETGGGRVILSLNLQPTQLRIGMTISRGSAENSEKNIPEVARVEGTLIIVEPYSSRKNWGARR